MFRKFILVGLLMVVFVLPLFANAMSAPPAKKDIQKLAVMQDQLRELKQKCMV